MLLVIIGHNTLGLVKKPSSKVLEVATVNFQALIIKQLVYTV